MILVFTKSDGQFHHATSSIDKFYGNSEDHVVVRNVDDYDPNYLYSYVDGEVVKGDLWTLTDEELAEIEADRIANLHVQPRMKSYPSITDQLDMLFHDIENGTLDTTGQFYNALKSVKDAHPKS